MPKFKRISITVMAALLAVCVLISAVWFGWSRIVYSRYIDGMEENYVSNFLVPRYYTKDADYTYLVKFPDYLQITGNFAVSANSDAEGVQAFLVWVPLIGERTYGLIIADAENGYQIYTDKDGSPLNEGDRAVADRYAEEIGAMVRGAQSVWGEL